MRASDQGVRDHFTDRQTLDWAVMRRRHTEVPLGCEQVQTRDLSVSSCFSNLRL